MSGANLGGKPPFFYAQKAVKNENFEKCDFYHFFMLKNVEESISIWLHASVFSPKVGN